VKGRPEEEVALGVMFVVVTLVGGIERVAVLGEGVSAGAVAVIVSPKTENMEVKEVIDRTVVGIWGEGVESCCCCRGLRPRRFDGGPVILKNGP
jgi:hypothetical protein